MEKGVRKKQMKSAGTGTLTQARWLQSPSSCLDLLEIYCNPCCKERHHKALILSHQDLEPHKDLQKEPHGRLGISSSQMYKTQAFPLPAWCPVIVSLQNPNDQSSTASSLCSPESDKEGSASNAFRRVLTAPYSIAMCHSVVCSLCFQRFTFSGLPWWCSG